MMAPRLAGAVCDRARARLTSSGRRARAAHVLLAAVVCLSLLARTRPTALAAAPTSTGYLHTEGARIVDASGREVHFTGVNWFGLETCAFAPHGLWSRNWRDMMLQIRRLGFNTIRLPSPTNSWTRPPCPSPGPSTIASTPTSRG